MSPAKMMRNLLGQLQRTLNQNKHNPGKNYMIKCSAKRNTYDTLYPNKKQEHWTARLVSHFHACKQWELLVRLYCEYTKRSAKCQSSRGKQQVERWHRFADAKACEKRQIMSIVYTTWRKWDKVKNESRVKHLLQHSTGVYCYVIPELKVASVVNTSGESLLANEFVVVKLGQTCPKNGGFEARLGCEISEISRWRYSCCKTMHERLIFLLPETKSNLSEKKLLACLGARIGTAPVHVEKTRPSLDALIKVEPARTMDDLLLYTRKRLSVKHAWRIWLSAKAQRTLLGPSELLVIPKQLQIKFTKSFHDQPGVFNAQDVLLLAKQTKENLREITIDFTNPTESLGPLTFLTDSS